MHALVIGAQARQLGLYVELCLCPRHARSASIRRAACTLSSWERRPDRWAFSWSYVFAHAVTCTLCVCAETEAHKYRVEFLYSVTMAC